jgi:hypothetical protein
MIGPPAVRVHPPGVPTYTSAAAGQTKAVAAPQTKAPRAHPASAPARARQTSGPAPLARDGGGPPAASDGSSGRLWGAALGWRRRRSSGCIGLSAKVMSQLSARHWWALQLSRLGTCVPFSSEAGETLLFSLGLLGSSW